MRAIVAETLESLASYAEREVPEPEAGPGQVLIRVAACGVGYVDSLVALGRYQVKPPLPHVPGQEVAGVVAALGEGVTGLAVGQRVTAMAGRGFAELAVAPAPMVWPIPDRLPFAEAAALPLNYLTALHGLKDRARLTAGETLLVLGAAGGVGSAAVQLGKALGAKVVAAASAADKRDFALAQGADAVIDTAQDGWRDRLKAACGGKGPDVVFDPVCGPLFELAFRSLHWRGRHLVVGFVGGPIPALPANLTLMKGAALIGVDVRQHILFDGREVPGQMAELLAMAADGRIRPAVGTVHDFADFGAALNAAISGQGCGKAVLLVGGEGLA
ncbi:NADPH:quinone oxidoreductase family protein [Sandaracinobacter neustonicus]|uniref:NADPH:quinone oxidoreductase family protein n=1 Tax=Sandaracinobacter neustonicus TaxID=1715348 RepID=A0A501XD39_9SPHN|nr:NADPH:quinone oxidoreductase family protein [Sandaracinobacter neustonicus]TPE58500.1 NADPH:quinone oxidoreductase family protein [Sandaracinobacter neustonicus]